RKALRLTHSGLILDKAYLAPDCENLSDRNIAYCCYKCCISRAVPVMPLSGRQLLFSIAVMLDCFALNISAEEFTDNNAAAWGAFASDNAAVSVTDDATRVRVGASSIRFVTASGFDTGVRYPAAPTAHWDASTNTHLVFWTFADNPNGSGF